MKRAILIFSLLISIQLYIYAQEQTLELSNVVVTAGLQEQQLKESGRNIITMRASQLKQLPAHSIDELLRYLPGVEVQQRGPQGSQSDIVLRGGTFQQVLVIIDGIKLNDPLTGHFNSYIPINTDEIERIEILKGAASAIYGSEAVGGVINIITKTFYLKNNVLKNNASLKITAGEHGLLNGELYGSLKKKNTVLSAGVQTHNSSGNQLRGTKGYFHLTNGNVAFSQKLKNDWTIRFRTAVDFRKFNAQNFYTTFVSDTADEKVSSWWNHLSIQKKYQKGQLQMCAGYKKLKDQYRYNPISKPNINHTNLFTALAYYTSTAGKKNGYTGGIQWQRKEIKSNDRGNHALWHGAGFLILKHNPAKAFYINESLRLDWDENYGWIAVPQVNLSWTPAKFTYRFAAGRSFRDADFTERYNNYNKALVTGGSIGNPALTAESSWNIEAGADFFAAHTFRISSTFFTRWHKNLIDWTPTPYAEMPRKINLIPTGNYALAKNIKSINTTGFEVDLIYSRKINTDKNIFFTLGYSRIQSKSDEAVPSFYISSHAKQLFNFSFAYGYRRFNFSLNGLYKQRKSSKAEAIQANITSSYFICNSKISYMLIDKKGKLFFQADNLFNKTYSDLLGAAMPGRWLSGGIEINL